jgi:undecaprenyl-diphosphatase
MDYQPEHLINGPAGAHLFWDTPIKGVIGGAELLFLGLIALWFVYGWVTGQPRDRQGAITDFVAALAANQVIAHLWARPRPFVAHPEAVHVLLSRSGDPSFPSDRTAATCAITSVLCFSHRRLGGAAALLFAALVAYARVDVGAHYPGDVLGGVFIGVFLAWLLVARLAPLMTGARSFVDRLLLLVRLPLPS